MSIPKYYTNVYIYRFDDPSQLVRPRKKRYGSTGKPLGLVTKIYNILYPFKNIRRYKSQNVYNLEQME